MNMNHPTETVSTGQVQRPQNRFVSFLFHVLLPLLIFAAGVALTVYLMKTGPEAKVGKRPPTATLVEVTTLTPTSQEIVIEAMGEIVPAREIDLRPRVSGEIVEVSREFIPGGHFSTGQSLLYIDPTDYRLALDQLESEVRRTESDLSLEMGNQRIAAKEFALLNERVSPEERALILRQPQLDKLKATLASNQSKLEQARINLDRTTVKAPFNSVVANRSADVGTRVSESMVLASLVGTDYFWLRLTVPLNQLDWLTIPKDGEETGSEVRIYPPGSNQYRVGQVIRLEPALESQGRMAQLLVKIDDPLCFKPENHNKIQLLLNSFVTAEIIGTTVDNSFSISRSHVHDGNNIWIMNENGALEIREVAPLFRSRDRLVVADGITDGERLVTSPLASPVAGIPLRLPGDKKDMGKQPGMNGERPKGNRGPSNADQ